MKHSEPGPEGVVRVHYHESHGLCGVHAAALERRAEQERLATEARREGDELAQRLSTAFGIRVHYHESRGNFLITASDAYAWATRHPSDNA